MDESSQNSPAQNKRGCRFSLSTLLLVGVIICLATAYISRIVSETEPDDKVEIERFAKWLSTDTQTDFYDVCYYLKDRRLMHLTHLGFAGEFPHPAVTSKANCVYLYITFILRDSGDWHSTFLFECYDSGELFFDHKTGDPRMPDQQEKLLLMSNFYSAYEYGDFALDVKRVWLTPVDGPRAGFQVSELISGNAKKRNQEPILIYDSEQNND